MDRTPEKTILKTDSGPIASDISFDGARVDSIDTKIRALIVGSCVTRDAFGESKKSDDELELVGYFARSSLASSFGSRPIQLSVQLDQLSSNFQRRMVELDLSHGLSEVLRRSNYDVLLLDCIDERFDLFVDRQGGICTLSNELLSTGFDPNAHDGSIIKSGGEQFFELWAEGWASLVRLLREQRLLERLLVNKVFWSSQADDGKGFGPSYSDSGIAAANAFLAKLYAHMSKDLDARQFITSSPDLLVGKADHRWGRSPFHYSNDYYDSLRSNVTVIGRRLVVGSNYPPSYLSDRVLGFWRTFSASGTPGAEPLVKAALGGGGTIGDADDFFVCKFSGGDGSYQVRFSAGEAHYCNGVSVKLRLRGWQHVRYVGIGYTFDNSFCHVKCVNILEEEWVTVSIGHSDIAWGWQNSFQNPGSRTILDIRIYVRGTAGEEASIDVHEFCYWREEKDARERVLQETITPVSSVLIAVLHDYLKKCFRDYSVQAREFLATGKCPLYGGVYLDWAKEDSRPAELDRVGTFKFSWHALHPATILMLHAQTTGETASLYAARELVADWLNYSYFKPDPDLKFAWYDHGTAERCLAFVLMWINGVERGFDNRFMNRLRDAIFRHAQLLASEVFYASHQPTRYHNHAWFQDLSLLTVALAFPSWPCAKMWEDIAVSRLTNQFDNLIIRDNGYAVFVENSIGYHHGVQRIVEFAGKLAALCNRATVIPETARELAQWSEFLRYPDNRSPAQGDTFRRPNPEGTEIRRVKRYQSPSFTILPKAGYAVVKGNHDDVPFMFTLFSTSLSRTHKHEDNLSFTLFFDGLEWLIDPSFYSHEYREPIPGYLRSAAAHNALVFPNLPYSIDPHLAEVDGKAEEESFYVHAAHRAYKNITVKRSVRGRLDRLDFSFTDTLQSSADYPNAYLMLHCGEGVRATAKGQSIVLTHRDSPFQIVCNMPSSDIRILNGKSKVQPVRGVAGHGFLKMTNIDTCECSVTDCDTLKWSISVAVSDAVGK